MGVQNNYYFKPVGHTIPIRDSHLVGPTNALIQFPNFIPMQSLIMLFVAALKRRGSINHSRVRER